MKSVWWLMCAGFLGLVAGCAYHHPSTGYDYLLNNRYGVFQVSDKPAWSLSNFVGFTMLPLQDEEDLRGRAAADVFADHLRSAGYVPVTTAEFLHSSYVAAHTFLVGISYAEEFFKGKVKVRVDLHAVAPETQADVVFWSWEVLLDKYPLERATFEGAVKDLFTAQPLQLGSTEPIFPPMRATSNVVQQFHRELSLARGRVPH